MAVLKSYVNVNPVSSFEPSAPTVHSVSSSSYLPRMYCGFPGWSPHPTSHLSPNWLSSPFKTRTLSMLIVFLWFNAPLWRHFHKGREQNIHILTGPFLSVTFSLWHMVSGTEEMQADCCWMSHCRCQAERPNLPHPVSLPWIQSWWVSTQLLLARMNVLVRNQGFLFADPLGSMGVWRTPCSE